MTMLEAAQLFDRMPKDLQDSIGCISDDLCADGDTVIDAFIKAVDETNRKLKKATPGQ